MTALLHFFENLDKYDLVAALIGCAGAFLLWIIYDVCNAPIYPQEYDLPFNHPANKRESC